MPVGTRPQPPAGTARVAIRGLISTHAWVNVLWLRLTHTAAVTINDLETISNGLIDSYGTRMILAQTVNVSALAADVTFIPSAGTSLQYTHTETKAGGDANTLNDASACAVIDWLISDYYRGGHPRTYLPGVPANVITNASSLTSGYSSALASNANLFRNEVNALTSTNVTAVELGTVRFQSAHAWMSPPVFRAYTGAKVRTTLGSQRRRLTG